MNRIFVLLFSLFSCWCTGSCQIQGGRPGKEPRIPYGHNPMAGSYIQVRGFSMYMETYGKGQALLMIHGNGGSMAAFRRNIPYFVQAGYRVILADSRSQGKSLDPGDSLSFEMMADDEHALLDSLHIDSADVLGWSDGGIVALLLAIRYPEMVQKLAATGANLWPDSSAVRPSLYREENLYYDSLRNHIFHSSRGHKQWKLFLLDWQQPHISLKDLESIRCPALIIAGDHDLIRIRHTLQIYRHIPRAYLWILPDSGHGTLIEHSHSFNRTVDHFFRTPYSRP